MGRIVFWILGIIILVFISILVYTAIYNAKISRQLQQKNMVGKQWPSPRNVVLTVVIIILAICFIGSILNNKGDSQTVVYSANQYADYVSYTSDEIKNTAYKHYTEAFETGELAGYDKIEKTEGDFHYMYFISSEKYNILHPSFILFVEYTGDKKISGYLDESRIYHDEGNSWGGCGGGNAADYYCVIGNINFETYMGFSYRLSVYDDTSKLGEDKRDEESKWKNGIDSIDIWIG